MEIKAALRKTHVQIIILLVLLVAFVLLERGDSTLRSFAGIVGLAFVAVFVGFVALEIKEGANSHGWKHEIVDTILALGFALALWFGAQLVLNTSVPISAVVSCSMLENLNRGDFVIVQGTGIKAYEISMESTELAALKKGITTVEYNGTKKEVHGSIYSYCIAHYFDDMCKEFVKYPEQFNETIGPFKYNYEKCTMKIRDSASVQEPCMISVEFKGNIYYTNFSHDTIVYQPPKTEYFSLFGDIVHRAYFKIDVNGEKYYLTKGDNNPILDLMVYSSAYKMGNTPIPEKNQKGRVLLKIPFLGYAKLLIAGQLTEPDQCKQLLSYQHTS